MKIFDILSSKEQKGMHLIRHGWQEGSCFAAFGSKTHHILKSHRGVLLVNAVENAFVANVFLGNEADALA
jgi:hypothetical protein